MLRKGVSLKLGILGGTFDPIHVGHLRLAEEVSGDLGLEKILLIPAAYPPHKEKAPVTSFSHRLAMTRLAASDSSIFEIEDLEGRRQGLSYSIETLKELRKRYQSNTEFYFILGIDAFLEIETWKDWSGLFDYAHFVVINRPGYQSEALDPFLASLNSGIKKIPGENKFVHPSGNILVFKEKTVIDISSTDIRDRVSKGQSIRLLVPEVVRTYIAEKGLYKT